MWMPRRSYWVVALCGLLIGVVIGTVVFNPTFAIRWGTNVVHVGDGYDTIIVPEGGDIFGVPVLRVSYPGGAAIFLSMQPASEGPSDVTMRYPIEAGQISVRCDQHVSDPSLVKPSISFLVAMTLPPGRLAVAITLRGVKRTIRLAGVVPDFPRPASAIGRPDFVGIDIVGDEARKMLAFMAQEDFPNWVNVTLSVEPDGSPRPVVNIPTVGVVQPVADSDDSRDVRSRYAQPPSDPWRVMNRICNPS